MPATYINFKIQGLWSEKKIILLFTYFLAIIFGNLPVAVVYDLNILGGLLDREGPVAVVYNLNILGGLLDREGPVAVVYDLNILGGLLDGEGPVAVVYDLHRSKEGDYTCLQTNEQGQQFSETISVFVVGEKNWQKTQVTDITVTPPPPPSTLQNIFKILLFEYKK